MQSTTFTFTSDDGPEIFCYKWAPEPTVKPRAAVQIAHGAAEHAGRYARFGAFLAEAGFVAYADDHRGHGKTAGTAERAGIMGPDGWNGMLRDLHRLTCIIQEENRGQPVFFFGHSMGSMLAQHYSQIFGLDLKGAILCGTMGTLGNAEAMVDMAEQAAQAYGDEAMSTMMAGMFAGLNQQFAPGKTGFEWLTRDEAEVRKYMDDPWCKIGFCNRFIVDWFKGAVEMWDPENEARIPKGLPLLVITGEQDPVGANTVTVKQLIERYLGNGMSNITAIYYPGARHELLNETNRDQVQRDVLDWMNAVVAA